MMENLLLLAKGDSNKELLSPLLCMTPYKPTAAYTLANAKRNSLLLLPNHKNVIEECATA